MGMRAMDNLKDMLCRELDEISMKGELSAGDLETANKLTDTIKNIDKIKMLEEDEGYSQRGGDWTARGMYSGDDMGYARRRNSYHDDGESYANRGKHYVRGHYSYAEAKRGVREQIRDMMHEPNITQAEKTTLEKALKELEK